MYDLDNIQTNSKEMKKIQDLPAFRMLQTNSNQPAAHPTVTGNNLISNNVKNQPIYSMGININGMGVAGLWVSFILLTVISIAVMAIMAIFVNTKFIDQPLKIKVMD